MEVLNKNVSIADFRFFKFGKITIDWGVHFKFWKCMGQSVLETLHSPTLGNPFSFILCSFSLMSGLLF